jgi:predicted RNase H-like HicB family nuclease
MTTRYPVIIETGPGGGYSAYAPDVPGCVAAASTRDEVRRLIEEALHLHLADADIRPTPSEVVLVEV